MKLEKPLITVLSRIHSISPEPVQDYQEKFFYTLTDRKSEEEILEDFKEFIGEEEYEKYSQEFERKGIMGAIKEKERKYSEIVDNLDLSFGSISTEEAKRLYSVIRWKKPQKIVETGVCNGVSTWIILEAVKENGKGELYSIDYPMFTDQKLEEFRESTFDDYGGAAVPKDKEPGWIVPEELKENWNFTEGKSQEKLPEILSQLGEIDVFMHDSEHSLPCMVFEYELAYNYLTKDGLIISDDINWNKAFEEFSSARSVLKGKITYSIGFMVKR